ncbi:MAG: hypothetical protein Q9M89_09925 [Persephonella sp.]|nr:hypothetical protein [Persephonella sp.]
MNEDVFAVSSKYVLPTEKRIEEPFAGFLIIGQADKRDVWTDRIS